jgi:adenylosuccinate synthase
VIANSAVIGLQWGDEGKGKVVDLLCEESQLIVRFQGGSNAGHTLVINGLKTILHMLTAGIMRAGTTTLVGPYVACDLAIIVSELEIALSNNAEVILSRSAPVVLEIHRLLDGARENSAQDGKGIGTTLRGIGPCYEDYASRRGVKMGDLTNARKVRAALMKSGYYAERCATLWHYGIEAPSLEATVDWCMSFADSIVPHLGDVRAQLADAQTAGKSIFFEGAQGVMLDVVHGRPYSTSSMCTVHAAMATLGVRKIDKVYGIAKAYTTRVGEGPYPTELPCEVGDLLREKGGEFGSTTGRPRRCGWMDMPALHFAIRVGGATEVVLTKLDVLGGFEEIKVCVGYVDSNGVPIPLNTTLTDYVLSQARPIYETLPGWDEDISECKRYEDLPKNAQEYVRALQKLLPIPITAISVGPDREQMIWHSC